MHRYFQDDVHYVGETHRQFAHGLAFVSRVYADQSAKKPGPSLIAVNTTDGKLVWSANPGLAVIW